MIIKNLCLRICLGFITMVMGIVFLRLYFAQNKDNIWGTVFRSLVELSGDHQNGNHLGWVMLFLGLFGIFMGMIVILFGFRLRLVGY